MEDKKKKAASMTLLDAIDKLLLHAKGSQLSTAFYRKVKRYTNYIGDKLDLSPDGCIVLALFVNESCKKNIIFSDITTYLDCRLTQVLGLLNAVDILVEREYVYRRTDRNSETSYRVPSELLNALRLNQAYQKPQICGLTSEALFQKFERLFEMHNRGEYDYQQLEFWLFKLLDENLHLPFCSQLSKYALSKEEKVLFLYMTHSLVNEYDDLFNLSYDLKRVFDESIRYGSLRHALRSGSSALIQEGLVDHHYQDGFADKEKFCLSLKSKNEILADIYEDDEQMQRIKELIPSDSISPKELFYPCEISEQIESLAQLLDDSNYQAISTRLKEQGFRTGFTCLFYGSPGTGKTETVLQLARRTKRDIIQVNIAEIKSMWVGESEKNIKEIFDNYRQRVQTSKLAPILLFNEADAILGIRQERAERAIDKMENSIQNIILQEMESLNGILIATTNLASNLDKAFERRFLYKIKFNKPTIEARISIWSTMLPELKQEEVQELAHQYAFSGGQIENIARHYAIDKILFGESDSRLTRLHKHCKQEKIEQGSRSKIGF